MGRKLIGISLLLAFLLVVAIGYYILVPTTPWGNTAIGLSEVKALPGKRPPDEQALVIRTIKMWDGICSRLVPLSYGLDNKQMVVNLPKKVNTHVQLSCFLSAGFYLGEGFKLSELGLVEGGKLDIIINGDGYAGKYLLTLTNGNADIESIESSPNIMVVSPTKERSIFNKLD